MQALHLLSLVPVTETRQIQTLTVFDSTERAAMRRNSATKLLSNRFNARWILDADISGCFDNMRHDWLLANIPMDKAVLRKWLQSGFVWKSQMFPTEAGTPQGGIISPTLANMTLDGMEQVLRRRFARNSRKS